MNNLRTFGRWDFIELEEMYDIEADLGAKMEAAFAKALGPKVGARRDGGLRGGA